MIKPQIDEALEDGKLTMDEVMDLADDVVDFVEDAKEIVESMPSKSALMKMTSLNSWSLHRVMEWTLQARRVRLSSVFFN